MPDFDFGSFTNDLATQQIEPQITEATPGEVQEKNVASFASTFPVWRQSQIESRRAAAGQAPTTDYGAGMESMPYDPTTEDQPHTPQDVLQQDDGNAMIKASGAQGMTPLTGPISAAALKGAIDDHVQEQNRQSVIARNGNSILSGAVARFGVGALVSLADPLNDMAMMLPVAPEAWTAARLAQAGGIFGRAGVRAGVGAAEGAVGMAALQPVQALQDQATQTDYDFGEGLRQIAIGAVMGGAGHAIAGGIMDRFQKAGPDTATASLQTALADVMNQRKVDTRGVLDFGDATEAADALEKWHAQQVRINNDADALRSQQPPDAEAGHSADIEAARDKMEQSYEQARQLRGDIEKVPKVDEATQARLDDIHQELGGVIPSARRADLEQERDMLHGGSTGPDASLEGARSAAQVQGLSDAADRAHASAQDAENTVISLRAKETTEQAAADTARASADRSTRIGQAKIDSRESTLQSLMERQVRQYAGKINVDLQPGEAASIAKDVRTAQPGEVHDIIADHLNRLAGRSDRTDVAPMTAERGNAPPANSVPTTQAASGPLRAEADGAARDMAARRMNPTDDEASNAERLNKSAIDTAPKYEGVPADDLAEVQNQVADMKAEHDAEIAAGRMQESEAVKNAGKDFDDEAKASGAYASCLVANGAV